MEAVQHLVSMGFSRDQAQEALRVADNNIEKAVSYLFDGSVEISNKNDIPTEVFGPPPQYPEASGPPDSAASNSASEELIELGEKSFGPDLDGSSSMESLANSNNETAQRLADVVDTDADSDDVLREDIESSREQAVEISFPEVTARGSNPMAVLNKSEQRYENWLVPLLLALNQVDEFHHKFVDAKGTPLLEKVAALLRALEDPERNYVVNDSDVQDSVDTIEELIPRLYELLDADYSKAYGDHFLEQLLKSTVSSREEQSTQDMFIIEIDYDNRCMNIYDTLNELFWGRDLEGLGNICFDKIGDFFTVYYFGDDDDRGSQVYRQRDRQYAPSVLEVKDMIYPGIYSKEYLDTLMEIKQRYDDLNEQGSALNQDIISLKVFQGRKVEPILGQAIDFLKDDETGGQLQKIVDNLNTQKAVKEQQLQSLIQEIEKHDVRKIENLHALDQNGYKLMLVMLSEMEYYYYHKPAQQWVYSVQKLASGAAEFETSFLPFEEVSARIKWFSTRRSTPIGLIYCAVSRLDQKWTPDNS